MDLLIKKAVYVYRKAIRYLTDRDGCTQVGKIGKKVCLWFTTNWQFSDFK